MNESHVIEKRRYDVPSHLPFFTVGGESMTPFFGPAGQFDPIPYHSDAPPGTPRFGLILRALGVREISTGVVVPDQSIPIDAARDLTSRLVDARFVPIEGSGHDIHIDAPDRWADEVLAFVATLPP